jgi:hypothetical protein
MQPILLDILASSIKDLLPNFVEVFARCHNNRNIGGRQQATNKLEANAA